LGLGEQAQDFLITFDLANRRKETLFMGRQASFHINSQYQQNRQRPFSPLASLGCLPLLFIVALFVTCFLATGNATAEMLFQSPQSPPTQPSPEQPPAEQPPAEQPPAEQPPAEQPPVEQLPTEQPSAEQPTAEQPPVEQPPAEQPTAEQPPVEQPSAEQPLPESGPLPGPSTSEAPLSQEPPLPESPKTGKDELSLENEQASNFILDEAELIDTVVVSGAYIWLCCGVILFLLIPLFLLLVYIRGRSKIVQEEGP
jgi:hypothetical protein